MTRAYLEGLFWGLLIGVTGTSLLLDLVNR